MNRALAKIDKRLQREFQKELREVAEPVARDIRRRAEDEHWGPKTVSGIVAGSSMGGAIVRQKTRKVAWPGRPDFGSLQMRKAFIPGAVAAEPVIYAGVERMLARLTSESGLGPV